MKTIWAKFFTVFCLILVSCSVEDPPNGFETEGPSLESPIFKFSIDPPATILQDFPLEITPSVSGSGLIFSLSNQPSWLSIDSSNGQMSGTPLQIGTFAGIKITATKDGIVDDLVFDLTVKGDPIAEYIWHLENLGQNGFSENSGVTGEGMKIKAAHRLGYSGNGILVAISDSGLEIAHEDLADNIILEQCKNYAEYPNELGKDPTNSIATEGDHGTSVAGIVGAVGWNSLGGRGVAPEVSLVGINFLGISSEGEYYYNSIPGALIDQAMGTSYDIFNQSWGADELAFIKIPGDYLDTLYHGVANGREGKGSLYVRAAGNSGHVLVVDDLDDPTVSTHVSLSANVHEFNNTPYSIVVGALSADGKKTGYSSFGANLWVSAPGGDDGKDYPAIITTDQSGCEKGYSKEGSDFNIFEFGHALNPECHYTSIFNGTSSATPNVSGVIALMLEANPNLSWRDAKHILLTTADQVDADIDEVISTVDLGNIHYSTTESGWIENAAGYHFHNWYGFGRVNAERAVKAALNYQSSLEELKQTVTHSGSNYCNDFTFCSEDTWIFDSETLFMPIPQDSSGITHSLSVGVHYTIEAVQIRITVDHLYAGDIGVELKSPSGTKSLVLQPSLLIEHPNIDDFTLLTNAFYGEDSFGDWEIRVFDGISEHVGAFRNWKINIIGHDVTP